MSFVMFKPRKEQETASDKFNSNFQFTSACADVFSIRIQIVLPFLNLLFDPQMIKFPFCFHASRLSKLQFKPILSKVCMS